jgi:hypothetical protein
MAQIFMAHSSKDKPLIDWMAANLRRIGIEVYVAGYDSPSPTSLDEKLTREITRSQAIFLILTRNVARSKNTSVIIQWEIATAQNKKKPVYVFSQKGVKVPLMIRLTTDYGTFDPVSRDSLVEAMSKMLSIGKRLKTQEEKNRALMVRAFGEFAKAVFTILGST